MAKQTLWQRIKGIFSGGKKQQSTKKSSAPKRVTREDRIEQKNTGGGSFDKRELLNRLRGNDAEDNRPRYKSMADATKETGVAKALNAKNEKFEEIKDYAKKNPPKTKTATEDPKKKAAEESRARLQKRLDDLEKERKEFHKATNNKYNTKTGDEEHDRKAYALRVGGYGNASPEVQKHSVEYHPIITSGARGLASGATFGATELGISKLSKKDKERAEAEEFYQENKNKTAETLGEIAGSLVSFGGATKGATKAAEKLVGTRTGEKAVEVGGKLLTKSAERTAKKQIKKGLIESASKELVSEIGKNKAKRVATALAEDAITNATVGGLYDFNKATAQNKIGSDEWKKEMRDSALFNLGAGTLTAGIANAAGGREVTQQALETLAKRGGDSGEAAREALRRNLKTTVGEADEVAGTAAKNADNAQASVDDAVKGSANEVDGNRQMTFEDAERAAEERKTNANVADEKKAAPKSKKQAKKEKAEDTKFFNSLDDVGKKSKEADASMREQTGGEFGVRQGTQTAAEHAPIDEAKRIKQEVDDVYKTISDGNIKELFTDENAPFSVFKTANKAERKKVAEAATSRVNEGSQKVADRLFEKAERLRADLLNNSALTSGEHVTLDDVADIIALRNKATANGYKLPAKYEEAFTNIIEWQRTESAQMLKATDLFLKENDQNYRKMLLSRDVNNYLRKVLNADDATIADIKRSLDANNGEGYFDKMIDILSEFKGDKNEAAFRKAYADFQAEIFMNTKPTVWDTVNLWRHTLMLSSPKTGANNVIGNVLQRAMYNISDVVNMAGESVARGINKDAKRTTAFLKTGDQRRLATMYTNGKRGERNIKNAKYLTGFKDQAFADAINNVADADVGDMMASSKYMGEVVKGLKYKPQTVGGKVQTGINNLGGAISQKYVSTMLNEPDSWFVERNYRSALLKYLEANGVNSAETLKGNENVLKEAREFAKDVALENTYKKANNVVSFLEGIRKKGHTKGSNLGYKTGAIILDAELPYLKVPANLVVNNFKYSPMGVFSTAVDAYKYVKSGDINALNKATRDLSKSLTGTGMAALGYMMFCKDQTDDDSWGFIGKAKDELKEYGVRDNSFKIGNQNFSIANMGIGSVQFLMGAALAEDLAEQGATPPHQIAIDALSKTVDTVADMSLMENAVSLLDTFGNGGDYEATVLQRLGNAATEVAGDYAAQFIPNPMRGVAKGMTSADLDTGVKKGDTSKVQRILERNRNNFVQGLPVVNEKVLPHKVDTHGNLVNERTTTEEKGKAIANNLLNPLSPRTVNIPEADKEELKVKDEDGKSYKPKGFDPNRKYEAKVGQGKGSEKVRLTGKEREQVARAAKNSGYDGASNLIKKGMFGDRLGDRAQEILKNIPDDEEAAREYIFSTPEWKNSSNEQKKKWLDAWYGEGSSRGVNRTRNAEAFINVAGHNEGEFRWQNDISYTYQEKYNNAGLEEAGIDKGKWVDILEACQDSNHKWNEETLKNQDTINSAKKTKAGILSIDGLTPEQRIAAYNVIRGKRTGFGWYDWDGVSGGGSGYYRGYRRGWRHYGHGGGSRKSTVPKIDAKSMASSVKKATATKVKLEPPTPNSTKVAAPKPKFKKYEV